MAVPSLVEGDERTPKGSGVPLLAFGFAVALLFSYVMSTGPVVYLYQVTGQRPGVAQFIGVFYAPLDWAYENTAARGPIHWYVELWK